MHVLQLLEKLEELNLSRNEIRYLRPHVLKLDMITSTVKFSPFDRPTRRAVLRRVLVLSRRDQNLETICLLFTKFEAYLFLGSLEGLTDCDSRKQLSVERLRKADRHRVEDCLTLLAADDVGHVTLLEYLSNEL